MERELQNDLNALDFVLEQEHMDNLLNFVNQKMTKVREQQRQCHASKLEKMGTIDLMDTKHVNMNMRCNDKTREVKMANPIFNLSARQLHAIQPAEQRPEIWCKCQEDRHF